MQKPLILALESSCDDTAVAVLEGKKILANIISTQEIHEVYGGVYPEFAARAHQDKLIPTLDFALKKAQKTLKDFDVIACTQGPGLVGSLMVTNAFAKSLSLALNLPLIGVHHLKGHILAQLLEDERQKNPDFPFLSLVVSGGHTQWVWVENPYQMEILGETQDDAVGECFDKTGKMLGLTYPAGPQMDLLAKQGDPKKFKFPMPKTEAFHFSFSGIKTAVLYFIQNNLQKNPHFIQENLFDLCASIQEILVETLWQKVHLIIQKTGAKTLCIGGGVAANSRVRSKFLTLEEQGIAVYFPHLSYCTDNAAMIGVAAYYQWQKQDFLSLDAKVYPRMVF